MNYAKSRPIDPRRPDDTEEILAECLGKGVRRGSTRRRYKKSQSCSDCFDAQTRGCKRTERKNGIEYSEHKLIFLADAEIPRVSETLVLFRYE